MQAYFLDSKAPVDDQQLAAVGVLAETLPIDPAGHQQRLDELMHERGYGTQDEVQLSPDMENLDVICAKFIDEHLHEDDEVRFVLEGAGIFDIRSQDDVWMRLEVGPGDLIIVPKDLHHRFMLGEDKHIRCVRLFKDPSGWVPVYRNQA